MVLMKQIITETKGKRNYAENEALIAESIRNILIDEGDAAELTAVKISRETGIHPDVVRDHLYGDNFFPRNINRVTADFESRVGGTKDASVFATRFIRCVYDHSTWFDIEFAKKSYRLFEGIMDALKPTITSNWPSQTQGRREVFYHLYCRELFLVIQFLSFTLYGEEFSKQATTDVTKLTKAFQTGLSNTMISVAADLYYNNSL